MRRTHVRELADITDVTIGDASLDARIDAWDEAAKTYFQVQGQTLDGTEDYFRNLITVSNLLTSSAIRQSIGGRDNIDVARDQKDLAKSLISAQNSKEPEQGEDIIHKTAGIGDVTKQGEFA